MTLRRLNFLCMCMYVYMHACMYTHTLNFPYICMNVYIHAYTHVHMHLHINSKIMNGQEGSYGINVFWCESEVNKLPLRCIDLALRMQNGDKLIYRLSYIFICVHTYVYTNSYQNTNTYTHIPTFICIQIHTQAHTHIHK